jgi:hypothetical protein
MDTGGSFCPTGEPTGMTCCLPFLFRFLYNPRFGASRLLCLSPSFVLISCSAYSSILKMEATCSSENSVDFQRTTRCYIPKDMNLHVFQLISSYKFPIFTVLFIQGLICLYSHLWKRGRFIDRSNILLLLCNYETRRTKVNTT